MRPPIPKTTGNDLFAAFISALLVRYICAGLLLGAALVTASPLVPLITQNPIVITDTYQATTIRYELTPDVAGFDGCATVRWTVENAERVQLSVGFEDSQPVDAVGERETCPDGDNVVMLAVTTPEGAPLTYKLPLLVSVTRLAPVYALLALTLATGAGLLAFAPRLLLRPDRIYVPSPEDGGLRSVEWGTLAALVAVIVAAYWLTDWVHIGAALVTGIVFYGVLRAWIGAPESRGGALRLGLFAIVGMIAAPIFFPTLNARNLLLGYIPTSNLFHDQTYILLRPVTVLAAWVVVRLLRSTKQPWIVIGVGAGFTAFALLIHPAYGGTPLTTRFTPLMIMLIQESNVVVLALKLVLSSAFPLALMILYWRDAHHDTALKFTWAAYVVALPAAYLLSTSTVGASTRFVLSAQTGLDLLMLASMAYFARVVWQERDSRFVVAGTLLTLHVAAGVIWHGVNLASGFRVFWW